VHDNGTGISAELLPTIFDLFEQGARTLDRSQGGLGIGLTLVKRLVELHGGQVTASSPGVGRGSTFSIRLPTIAEATGFPAAETPTLLPDAGMRVLVVDDDADVRGVAIFAKAFMGIPAQQAAKATRPLMPAAAPAVLLHSLDTQQGVSNIILAMTRRDVGKPAFSLRKKRFVKTHALSLLGTTRLLSRSD